MKGSALFGYAVPVTFGTTEKVSGTKKKSHLPKGGK